MGGAGGRAGGGGWRRVAAACAGSRPAVRIRHVGRNRVLMEAVTREASFQQGGGALSGSLSRPIHTLMFWIVIKLNCGLRRPRLFTSLGRTPGTSSAEQSHFHSTTACDCRPHSQHTREGLRRTQHPQLWTANEAETGVGGPGRFTRRSGSRTVGADSAWQGGHSRRRLPLMPIASGTGVCPRQAPQPLSNVGDTPLVSVQPP